MNKSVLLLGLALLLGACTVTADVELPENPEGVDQMRISPCACSKIEYEGKTFKWLG